MRKFAPRNSLENVEKFRNAGNIWNIENLQKVENLNLPNNFNRKCINMYHGSFAFNNSSH